MSGSVWVTSSITQLHMISHMNPPMSEAAQDLPMGLGPQAHSQTL